MSEKQVHQATLIPGDGIGPSIAEAAVKVIEAAGVQIEWDVQQGDSRRWRAGEIPCDGPAGFYRKSRVALKGPITTRFGTGYRSVNVALRVEFDLYANVRPCVSMPGVLAAWPGVDIVIVRENTEGMYAGQELYTGADKSSAVL